MDPITPITPHAVEHAAPVRSTRMAEWEPTAPARCDRAEVSGLAALRARLDELPDIREGLVARIRAEILDGSYEATLDGKLDAVLDRIHEDL